MNTLRVGAFEAKTHLSALLDKVSEGQEVLITRRGQPVARLVPARQAERSETESVIEELRRRRAGLTLGDLHWKDLRDEGRGPRRRAATLSARGRPAARSDL